MVSVSQRMRPAPWSSVTMNSAGPAICTLSGSTGTGLPVRAAYGALISTARLVLDLTIKEEYDHENKRDQRNGYRMTWTAFIWCKT
jgi:hypothetical protein